MKAAEGQGKFFSQVMEISRDRFQSFSSTGGQAIVESIENKFGLFAPWAAIILVSGSDYRVTFKAHFKLSDASKFASGDKTVGEDGSFSDALRMRSFDYMKEYCNLYAGSLKRAFADANINVGISLPLLTRGFDEIFFPKADKKNTYETFWKLSNQLGCVFCSLFVEVVDADQFGRLSIKLDSSSEGEIEFL